MNKIQFYILNLVSGVLVLLFIGNLWLGYKTQALGVEVLQTQAAISNARRAEQFLTQISMRIARDSDKDPALRDLLIKHKLKVSMEVDGKKRDYP